MIIFRTVNLVVLSVTQVFSAEAVGFEPTELFRAQRFSRPPQSTTLPNLQILPLISNLQQIMAFRLVPFMTDFTHLHQPFEEIKFANISQRLSASTQLAKLESSLTRYLDYISSKILRKFVDPVRLELTTPCVQGRCSSHLSYEPLKSNIVVRFYIEDQF